MGAFETKTATATKLPTDLPPVKTAAQEHPDGAIYVSDNGKRYRLRHPRWVEIVARQADKPKTAAKK
jgi:hemin uptake protein HemP